MKIGYMGIPGSFSEAAAHELVKQSDLENVSYLPLVCAKNILEALKNNDIDYGDYDHLDTFILPIHHCLFKKSADISMEHLTEVASHPQALSQTKNTRAADYPSLKEREIEDTAIGAEWLAKGELPDTTAVICSKNAGTSWNLDLIAENIEDSSTNRTTFWLLKLK